MFMTRKSHPAKPSDEAVSFVAMAENGAYNTLSKYTDDQLRALQRASHVFFNEYDENAKKERQILYNVNVNIANERYERQKAYGDAVAAQNERRGAFIGIGCRVAEFADRLRELAPLDAEIMFPKPYTPGDELAARAATDRELDRMEAESRDYLNRDRREIAVIGEALAGFALLDSKDFKAAKAELEKRRDNRRKSLSVQESAIAVYRAERQRRIAERTEAERLKAELPDEVTALKERIAELEKASAVG